MIMEDYVTNGDDYCDEGMDEYFDDDKSRYRCYDDGDSSSDDDDDEDYFTDGYDDEFLGNWGKQ